MKRNLCSLISILMASIIIAMSFSFVYAVDFICYENNGMEFLDKTADAINIYNQIKNELPKTPTGGIPPQCLGDMFPVADSRFDACYINYRLWRDKNILVYGNYEDVPDNLVREANKKFKIGTQPSPGVKLHGVNDGYYKNPYGDLYRGEWKYHGFDISGNKFSNMNYIDDDSGTVFDERDWLKLPWTNQSIPSIKRPTKSIYNQATTGDHNENAFIQSHVQTWINKSLDQYHGVPLIGNKIDPEVYNYLNILSAPTPVKYGQGRMWHMKDDGSIWYQTITVPTIKKENLPVTVSITPVSSISIRDVGADMDDKPVELKFKVTSALNDDAEYIDAVKRSVYYTREDISSWKITFDAPAAAGTTTQAKTGIAKVGNKGAYTFAINTTYGFLRSRNWKLHLTATGQPSNNDGTWGNMDNASLDYTIPVTPVPPPEPETIAAGFTPEPDIPEIAFDGVPFTASDNTDMTHVTGRRVFVNGMQADSDEFFSGSYLFDVGDVGVNGLFVNVDVIYDVDASLLPAGETIKTHDIVYIYPTKPIANFRITSNTWKQNRLIKVENTCDAGNIRLVIQNYPITQYRWSFGGDSSQIRRGTDTDMLKELIYKEPGTYSITLECRNTLGRWSDPYTVDFEVLDDVAPAIGLNLTGSVTSRNEPMNAWFYNVCSTDGDVIRTSSIELWYDSDNNGTVDTKLNTWDGSGQFPSYTPAKLGYYKYIVKAQEDIVGDTLPQFITDQDKKSGVYEVEWWVDNFRPMSDLYVNIPIQRPSIDVFIMIDRNLDAAKKDYLLNNRMNMTNWLIGKNMVTNVQEWDMRTYTYNQPASTSIHTGGAYPSSSTSYSSNGYSGTLSLSSTSNNRYSRDEGHYTTQTESKTVSEGANNTNYAIYRWTGTTWLMIYYDNTQLPSSKSYSDGSGFSGTLYKGSGTLDGESGTPPPNPKVGDTYTHYGYWSCTYSGTVSRTVTVWVPNIVWYNDYTGYYSGTIYKDVRQPYTDTFNATSFKYVVYISDSTVSDLSDLNMVMGYAKSARLILAGTNAIKSQHTYDQYFDVSGKTVDVVANNILQSISDNSPAVEKYYVLQNQAFTMNVGSLDLENDPVIETGMQYVHEPDFFDNPTGTEPGSVSGYSDNSGWISTVKGSFANTGKYTIYRRIKDNPSADPNFSSYSYYSGPASLEVYVVRKPIALATLDWDYDAAHNVYKTTWVDKSYDPDHQYNRPDKGIIDRNIMWRQPGGQWNYGIPDNLAPGTYELNYYVLDPEGYWSDPFTMNFTLSPLPPVQFTASLRTLDSSFSLAGVPASEFLEAFNLWTRYPYSVRLDMALYNGAARVSTLNSVNYSAATGTKTGNDITWSNVPYQIPATLPDRSYTFNITAVGDFGQSSLQTFNVNVVTPVGLSAGMPSQVVTGTNAALNATTSKYVNTTTVQLFRGTAYQSSALSMTGVAAGNLKNWTLNYIVPGNIPAGNYTARFTSTTQNGNTQTQDVLFKVEDMKITGVTISGCWNHWRGQVDIFGSQLSNEPHRFLSLECVKIDVNTAGSPDRVVIRFSPELEAMSYTDPYGNVYDYGDDFFGYTIGFPVDSTIPVATDKAHWEYYLPMAPSTKDWDGSRKHPPYSMTVTAYKGAATAVYTINDIELTGNIYDLTYIQPVN